MLKIVWLKAQYCGSDWWHQINFTVYRRQNEEIEFRDNALRGFHSPLPSVLKRSIMIKNTVFPGDNLINAFAFVSSSYVRSVQYYFLIELNGDHITNSIKSHHFEWWITITNDILIFHWFIFRWVEYVMFTTLCTKYFCRRHCCCCKSLSLHLHTSTIFHQHVGNHKTFHYTSNSGVKHMLNRSAFCLTILLLLLFRSVLHRFHCYFSFTRRRLVHAPQSGNKTEPILESQNNTETIFLCGAQHTFTAKQPQSSTICFSMVSMVRHESQKSLRHCIWYSIKFLTT